MKNKGSKIILTVVFAGILVFGASFARAQTSNEEMIKMLQSLIQMLMQRVAQLQAQLAQKSTTTTTISSTGVCGWCGTDCIKKTVGMYCPDIAPPEGYRCAEGANGQCEKLQFATSTISSSLPDLVVTDLTCSPTTLQIGQSTRCVIAVKNNSSVAVPTHTLEAFSAYKGETSIYSINETLAAGETKQASFFWQCTANAAGIRAFIDSKNIIQESNENNNSQTITINCTAPTLPDLTITNLTATKTTLNIGETTTISAKESNIGNATAGHHLTGIFEDNKETPLNSAEINTMAAGYGSYITANYTCYTAGVHTITALADFLHQITTGEVQESNENNNSQTITINCTAPTSNLSVTCVSSKVSNTFNIGESFALFALPIGGSGSYPTAVWSGDVTGTGLSRIVSFSSAGTKTATVKVTDSNGATATASCSIQIINQSSFLDNVKNQLAQLSDLLKKLTAALLEMPR